MTRFRQPKKNKLTPLYDPTPYIVVKTKGHQTTAKIHNNQITKNTTFFKRIPQDSKCITRSYDGGSDYDVIYVTDEPRSKATVAAHPIPNPIPPLKTQLTLYMLPMVVGYWNDY